MLRLLLFRQNVSKPAFGGAITVPLKFGSYISNRRDYRRQISSRMAFATPDNAYFQTLTSLTTTKASIFSAQKSLFLAEKDKLISAVSEVTNDNSRSPLDRLKFLLKSLSPQSSFQKKPKVAHGTAKVLSQILSQNRSAIDEPSNVASTLQTLLATGEIDPAVAESEELLAQWQERLEDLLEKENKRLETATLMAKVVDEWVKATQTETEIVHNVGAEAVGSNIAVAKDEQMAMFTSLVFAPHPLDADPHTPMRIKDHLTALFESTPESRAFIKGFRNNVTALCRKFEQFLLWDDQMGLTIQSLLNSDLLPNDKRTILKEQILPNKIILKELTNVIQMWSTDLRSWTWASGLGEAPGVKLDVRLQLNGKYRVFMDEDITTAIFLQYIFLWWGPKLKAELKRVFDHDIMAWKLCDGKKLDKALASKLHDSLGADNEGTGGRDSAPGTIEQWRRRAQRNVFFMSQLVGSMDSKGANYYNENVSETSDEEDYSAEAEDSKPNRDTSPVVVKEKILRTMITELNLAKALADSGGSETFTVVMCDFKWFGPGLSHEVIIAVLKYFGLWDEHLTFFRNFLSIPCYFSDEAPIPENIKIRKRGVPMSHGLSDLFAEMLLFCLDFTVNQISDGEVFLHRCHDDIWFWSENKEKCELVWKEMTKFAEVFGLEFNPEKQGSMTFDTSGTSIRAISDVSGILPQGPIKWGFLDLSSTGELVPNEELVGKHIVELTRQLKSPRCTSSLLSLVEGWNRYYANFLPYHFGVPAYGLGKNHSKMVVSQLAKVQSAVLRNLNNNQPITIVNYFRSEISRRFPDINGQEIPEAWFYWPTKLGGLGIRNPIVKLSSRMVWKDPREFWHSDLTVPCEPTHFLDKVKKQDAHDYKLNKEDWENKIWKRKKAGEYYNPNETFISFEEYCSHDVRTLYSEEWEDVYVRLLSKPFPTETVAVSLSPVVQAGVDSCGEKVDDYWRRIYAMYGPGVVQRWGGFRLVEEAWMAGGLMSGVKEMRSRWEE